MKQYPFPDKESSMQILLTDYMIHKIPKDKIRDVFEMAWAVGEAQAEQFLEQYRKNELPAMLDILKKDQVKITCEDVDNVLGKYRYFCEYLSGKNQLTIYKKSVKLWSEHNEMSYENGLNLILYHEYFHYLEQNQIGMLSARYQVPILKIGPICVGKTGVPALSEIGANAFAWVCWEKGLKEKEENHAVYEAD